MICLNHRLFDQIASLLVDGMCDILEFSIRHLPAWHCNKQSRFSVDYTQFMNHKTFVNCDRGYGFQSVLAVEFLHPNVCYVHRTTSQTCEVV